MWEHHRKKGHFIVVEGNTRTAALRRIREQLSKEVEKLSRMQAKSKQYSPKDIADRSCLSTRSNR